MKDFFKMLFASTLGVFLAGIILSILSFVIFVGVIASFSSKPAYSLQKETILKLDLSGSISEREMKNPLDVFMGGDSKSLGLNDILDAIKKAKENNNIKGIYIKAGSLNAGMASLEPIRKALSDFKDSGKFLISYGDNYTQGAYYVSSVSDEVIMNPQGSLAFHGLAGGTLFLKGTLDKIGVKMQVFKVGTYKSAVEPYIQEKMSDANREQITAYMGDIWNHWLAGISQSRHISVENLNRYADEFMMIAKPETCVEYGFIDSLMYVDQVEEFLKEKVGIEKDADLKIASVGDLKTVPFAQKEINKDKIAILYAEGSIVGDEYSSNPYSSSAFITAKEFVKELNKLKKDENVKAVVFRVNSPGGSAYASEQIWHAVKELKEVKPIIVSMGDYAASGGYYISCGATQIVAEPTTLTGSIGIFGLIPDGEELAKKVGVTADLVKTNKHSDFGGASLPIPFFGYAQMRGMTPDEQVMMQTYIERGYDLFIGRCAEGRSKTKAEIDSIGQGRVWTGNQALQLGLVDKIGNLNDAIKLAAEAAGVKKYSLADYPTQKDFWTQILEESFGGMQVYFMKQFLGVEKYEQSVLRKNLRSYDWRQAVMLEEVLN